MFGPHTITKSYASPVSDKVASTDIAGGTLPYYFDILVSAPITGSAANDALKIDTGMHGAAIVVVTNTATMTGKTGTTGPSGSPGAGGWGAFWGGLPNGSLGTPPPYGTGAPGSGGGPGSPGGNGQTALRADRPIYLKNAAGTLTGGSAGPGGPGGKGGGGGGGSVPSVPDFPSPTPAEGGLRGGDGATDGSFGASPASQGATSPGGFTQPGGHGGGTPSNAPPSGQSGSGVNAGSGAGAGPNGSPGSQGPCITGNTNITYIGPTGTRNGPIS
jgi:hypothetical protein